MILMVLKHRRPLPTPEEAMHDLLEEETTASLTKELGDASTGAMGVVDVMVPADAEDAVDTMKAVEPETAMKLSAPIAKLTAILQMHAESGNALRREETMMSRFVSSADSKDTSKSIASPTNV
jgi:hypothetical protein